MRSARRATAAIAATLIIVAACGTAPPASPAGRAPDPRAVAAAISAEGLRSDLAALAAATGAAPPYRAVGAPGYGTAADLVDGVLRAAGWTVTDDAHDATAFVDEGGSGLDVGGRSFGTADLRPLIFAPAGDVEGPVVAISGDAAGSAPTDKGCTSTDYGHLPPHAIVLVGPGGCLRREEVIAAQHAGAAAFLAVYPQAPAGIVYRPTLIEPTFMEIPAAAVSSAAADALLAAARSAGVARLVTRARTETVPTRSILAELPGSQPGAVIMLGAHLDSVLDGPGLNDDGSGVAALLAIARALGGTRPRATVRLAFWSGEELGLHGSMRYATSLGDAERRAILVYLNADMVASPNGYAGVYDEPGAPLGSNVIHDLLAAAVTRAGGVPVGVDIGGGSDHYGFEQVGIATGGIFAGASEPVTSEQAAASGAVAGRPADPCYHQACDDLANADTGLARVLTAALADVVARLANSPELLRR